MQYSKGLNTIPSDVAKQLPIFKILGNQLPEKLQTPESQKTMGKIFFWIILAICGYVLWQVTPTLISFVGQLMILGIYVFVAAFFIIVAPKLIRLFNRWSELMFVRGQKALNRKYGIETLQLSLQEVKDVQKEVVAKIEYVDGIKIDALTSAQISEDESKRLFKAVKRLTEEAGDLDKQSEEARKNGNTEQANELARQAKEARNSAISRQSEYEAADYLRGFYAQFANQSGKALEILKDNQSAGKMYIDLLSSSITIIRKKLEATQKMNAATQGLADIFDVKNKMDFQDAMEAVQFQISQNVAGIRRNLEFLKQSRIDNVGATASQSDMESFVKGIEQGSMQKLNVIEIASTDHSLSDAEQVDKTLNILD
jgi:hypothetical protein